MTALTDILHRPLQREVSIATERTPDADFMRAVGEIAREFMAIAYHAKLPVVRAFGSYRTEQTSAGQRIAINLHPVWPLIEMGSEQCFAITTTGAPVAIEPRTEIELTDGTSLSLDVPSLSPSVLTLNTLGGEALLSPTAQIETLVRRIEQAYHELRQSPSADTTQPDYYNTIRVHLTDDELVTCYTDSTS